MMIDKIEKTPEQKAFERAMARCSKPAIGGVVDVGSRAGVGAVFAQELATIKKEPVPTP